MESIIFVQLQIRSWKCNDRNSALQGYCQFSTPFRVLQASDLKLCLRPEISAMITLFLKERDAYILTSVFAAYTAGSMAGRGSTRQVSGRSGGGGHKPSPPGGWKPCRAAGGVTWVGWGAAHQNLLPAKGLSVSQDPQPGPTEPPRRLGQARQGPLIGAKSAYSCSRSNETFWCFTAPETAGQEPQVEFLSLSSFRLRVK